MAYTSQELKETAVAVVTAALNARSCETVEARIDQYSHDFTMLLDDITGEELFRLTSLLADMNSFLLETLSHYLEIDRDVVMRYFAQNLTSAETTETDGEETMGSDPDDWIK